YRAYYAFIGRPLTRIAARAEQAGTARHVGLETAELGRIRVASRAGGEIHVFDPAGRLAAHVAVPQGYHVLVKDGDAMEAGTPLLAENTSAIYGMANMINMLRGEDTPDCRGLACDGR